MSRRRGAAQDPGVSLFPFLAVLICLIGALVLMLLLVSREIRSAAIQAAVDQAAEQRAERPAPVSPTPETTDQAAPSADEASNEDDGELDPESRLALLEMRLSDVRGRQADAARALADQRTQLAHVEDHIRELEDEHARLRAAEQELDRLAEAKGRDRQAMAERIAYLREVLAEKEKALDEARKAIAQRPKVFAIVPYDGPHGTRRQPIYIECRSDGVYLQPQNIQLTPSDFDGPLGPQNPLASAVRAVSEAIILTPRESDGATLQPYPLLVVHPDGINAYYAARVALMSWEAEFGYELIAPDTPIVYPPVDPKLGSIATRAIQEARAKQRQLAALAPNLYAPGGRSDGTRGSAGGTRGDGFARVTGLGASKPPKPTRYTVGSSFAQGLVPYNGSLPGDDEEEPTGPSPGLLAAAEARRRANGTGNGSGSTSGDPRTGAGPNAGFQNGSGPGTGTGGTGQPGGFANAPAGPGGNPGAPVGSTGAGGPNGTPSAGRANSSFVTGAAPPGVSGASVEQGAPDWANPNQPAAAGAPQNAPKLGEYVESRDDRNRPRPRDPNAPNTPEVKLNQSPPDRDFVGERGENWALLDYKPTSISIRREVRVLLEPEQLTVLPKNEPIPFGGTTSNAIDPAVKQIQNQIRTWGIAGKNMYWRPSLVVEVTPGAERRYEELQRLLDGSGMEIRTEQWTVVRDTPVRR